MKYLFRRKLRDRLQALSRLAQRERSATSLLSNVRRFEPLEQRLMLHNGPFDTDPAYDPNTNFSIEADISIFVDSAQVTIPSGSGQGIEAVNGNGRIEFAPGPQSDFVTLGDFFTSWRDDPEAGSPSNIVLSDTQIFDNIASGADSLQMFVNGFAVTEDFAGYNIHDGDDIVLVYGSNPVVTINTNLEDILPATVNGEPVRGRIPVELRSDAAPGTVANFLNYANDGDYDNAIFHRLVSGFVLQGGGFSTTTPNFTSAAQLSNIPTDPPIQNEFQISNAPLTIAMAKLGGDPNSATNQWFFNLVDNSSNLDNQNGGFTVFGVALDSSILNSVTGLTTTNEGGAFTDLPLGQSSQLALIESISGNGMVSGVKFEDLDGDGVRDAGEPGLDNFTIYADANGNDQLDAGEISTTTAGDGSYVLHLPGGQQHTIREVQRSGFAQTLPADEYVVDLEVGGEVIDRDFGNTQLVSVTSIDLVAASDSGSSDSDDLTNFNNSSSALAPSFQIVGAAANETVRVRIDGAVVAEQTLASDGIVTLDGTNTISDGQHTVSVVKLVNGVESDAVSMTLTIDSSQPQITSQPPSSATVGETYSYNAESNEEGDSGFFYSLNDTQTGNPVSPSLGIVLDSLSGSITWTPEVAQLGDHAFTLVATDAAGNSSSQAVDINVSRVDLVRVELRVLDSSGNPVTEVIVGDSLQLQVLVEDLRSPANGVFSGYLDINFDPDLVTAVDINHGTSYGQGGVPNKLIDPPQTINDVLTAPGLLDEVGSFAGSIAPLGPSQRVLLTVDFTATGSGVLDFTTDPADVTAVHEFGLYNQDGAIPNDQIEFGSTSVTIASNFRILSPTIGPDEDSTGTSVPVADLAEFRDGFTGDLTITAVEQPANGTVTIASDGRSLTYVPNADFFGSDPFEYTVTDGTDDGKGNVDVAVQPVNDNPVAVDDSFQDQTNGSSFVVVEDVVNQFLPVLGNDTSGPDDPSSETLSVATVSGTTAQGGTVTVASNGQGVNYTAPADFRGTDTFTYTISDGQGGVSGQATVTLNVIEQNDPPTANDDTATVVEDSGATLIDVVANDSTAPDDGETITITEVGASPNGSTLSISNNMISYTPAADFAGVDTFTYTISDGNGGTDVGSVSVTVTNVNDPPTANDDSGASFRVTQNTSGNTLDILANDSALPDTGETLTIESVSGVSTGATVTVAADGQTVLYTPAASFLGTDTFTYTINDGNGLTDTATVTVEVVEFVPGSLSGFVYIDEDSDSIKEPGERGLEGVTITLTGTDTFGSVNRTTTTDVNGFYEFDNLAPGDYVIRETQPGIDFENDGIPLLDGEDAIGTQGGTLSADDEFTITLQEGVDGTSNNFGELKGRRLGGAVGIGGYDVLLFDASATNEVRRVTTTADGRFEFAGLAPDSYSIVVPDAEFLLSSQTLAASISNADSLSNDVTTMGRSAASLSYRDFMAFRSANSAHAAVTPGSNSQEWYSLDSGWNDVTDVQFQLSADQSTVTLEVTDDTGTSRGEIATSHPQIQVLAASPNGTNLIRFDGDRDSFSSLLTPVTTGGSGEGEGGVLSQAEGEGTDTQVTASEVSEVSNTLVRPVLETEPLFAAAAPEGDTNLFPELIVDGSLDSEQAEGEGPDSEAAVIDLIHTQNEVEGQPAVSAVADDTSHDERDLLAAVDEAISADDLLSAI